MRGYSLSTYHVLAFNYLHEEEEAKVLGVTDDKDIADARRRKQQRNSDKI